MYLHLSALPSAADGTPHVRRRVFHEITVCCILLTVSAALYGFTELQAQSGARIFTRQCARCHGDNGEGKDNSYRGLRAPALIGPTALPCKPRPFQKLRAHDFRTVKDVYDFVSATMPADQPASLAAEQYWDVLAYVLQRNHAAADQTRLDGRSSRGVTLHADCGSPIPPVASGVRP